MKCKDYKLGTILKVLLSSTVFYSVIGYFLYSYIKNIIVDVALKIEEQSYAIMNIKYAIVFSSVILICLATLLLFKLTYDNSKALYVDYLTGLGSKRFYDMKLKAYINKVKLNEKPLSLMIIDIDFFKLINDEYGHDMGDKVLQHVAMIIKMNTRKLDICFRCGGDEFAVILPDTNAGQTKLIGKRIIDKINDYGLSLDSSVIKPIKVTVSIGIAEWQPDMNIVEFSKCTDDALYTSKTDGRNRLTLSQRNLFE